MSRSPEFPGVVLGTEDFNGQFPVPDRAQECGFGPRASSTQSTWARPEDDSTKQYVDWTELTVNMSGHALAGARGPVFQTPRRRGQERGPGTLGS